MALQDSNCLQQVKERLLSIETGDFEPDWYLSKWLPPAVCEYFLNNVIEVFPSSVQWGVGKPGRCHLNAMEYAMENLGATPFFGLQYCAMWEGEAPTWEVHSWVVLPDGSIIDSGRYVPEVVRYVGIKWSAKLMEMLANQT